MEILSYAVFTAEADRVATDFLLLLSGEDFGDVGPRLFRGPLTGVDALFKRLRRQLEGRRGTIGREKPRLAASGAERSVFLVTDLDADGHTRIIRQHGLRSGGGDWSRSGGDEIAEHLLPESGVSFILVRHPHFPAPTAAGGED